MLGFLCGLCFGVASFWLPKTLGSIGAMLTIGIMAYAVLRYHPIHLNLYLNQTISNGLSLVLLTIGFSVRKLVLPSALPAIIRI